MEFAMEDLVFPLADRTALELEALAAGWLLVGIFSVGALRLARWGRHWRLWRWRLLLV